MNYCDKYKEEINLILDGYKEYSDCASLKSHLAQCEKCRQYYEDMRYITSVLRGLDDEEPPEGFTNSVMEQVRRERQKKKRLPKIICSVGTAAAVCALVFFSMGHIPSDVTGASESSLQAVQPISAEEKTDLNSLVVPSDRNNKQDIGDNKENAEPLQSRTLYGNGSIVSDSYLTELSLGLDKECFVVIVCLTEDISKDDFLLKTGITDNENDEEAIAIDRDGLEKIKTVCEELSVEYAVKFDNDTKVAGYLIIS